jgi:hypothetical protein
MKTNGREIAGQPAEGLSGREDGIVIQRFVLRASVNLGFSSIL